MRTIIAITLFIAVSLATLEHECGRTGGSPEYECGLFGLKALGKDDYAQKTASRAAALTLVKAAGCFTFFKCAAAGTALSTHDGKTISHVTYCGNYADACAQPAPKVAVAAEPAHEAEPAREEPVRQAEPEVLIAADPLPPAPATCKLNPRSAADCAALAKKREHCEDCRTSNCKGCQKVFIKYCAAPVAAATLEECLKRSEESDCPGHTDADCTKHARKGLARLCAEQVCQKAAPAPAVEVKPAVVPKPAVQYEAPAADKAVKAEVPKVEVPKAEVPKVEVKVIKAEPPVVVVPPVVNIVDVPCDHATLDTDLPRVIYIAAEEEDCTSALKAEVAELELLVDKLTVLLTLKGVQVGTGEECAVPGVKKTDENKKGGDEKKGGDGTTPGTPGTNGNPENPGTPKTGEEKKDGNGNNGEPKKDKTPETGGAGGGGKNPDDKTGKGGDDKGTKGGNGANGPNEGGEKGGAGTTGNKDDKDKGTGGGRGNNRLSTTGSSAAVNTMLTVGLVIGAAVCAGIAAVAIGLFASAAAATAPAVASAAPMAACAVNPLYTPLTTGGTNALH